MTIVFVELNRDLIKRDLARKALGKDSVITEFPDLLFVETPGTGRQAIFDGKRLSINLLVDSMENAAAFAGQACDGLLKATNEPNIASYGYNLRGSASKSGVYIGEHLLKICFGNSDAISQAINTEIISVVPKFSFNKHGALFTVTLMQSADNKEPEVMEFFCNMHFSDTTPPADGDMVTAQLLEYYGYCSKILGTILGVP